MNEYREMFFLLAMVIVCVYAIWALSRQNERLHDTVRRVTEANLALSEKPLAGQLSIDMEKSAHKQTPEEVEAGQRRRRMTM